jgi:hypothetical protein
VGVSVSAAVVAGRAHVFYYDSTNRDLRHAWQTGSGWRFATLDGARDAGFGSSAVSAGGVLHAFWVRRNDGALRAGRFDGTSWAIRTIDSTGVSAHQQSVGRPQTPETAAAVFRGRVRVVYAAFRKLEDVDGELFEWGELRLGSLTDAVWTFAVRPGLVECCLEPHLTVAPFADRLHVALNWIGLHRTFVFATTWRPAGWGPETSPGGPCDDGESLCDAPHLARFRRSLDLFHEDAFGEPAGLVRRVWNGAAFGRERLLQRGTAQPLVGGPSSHVRHDDGLLLAFGTGDLVVGTLR